MDSTATQPGFVDSSNQKCKILYVEQSMSSKFDLKSKQRSLPWCLITMVSLYDLLLFEEDSTFCSYSHWQNRILPTEFFSKFLEKNFKDRHPERGDSELKVKRDCTIYKLICTFVCTQDHWGSFVFVHVCRVPLYGSRVPCSLIATNLCFVLEYYVLIFVLLFCYIRLVLIR